MHVAERGIASLAVLYGVRPITCHLLPRCAEVLRPRGCVPRRAHEGAVASANDA